MNQKLALSTVAALIAALGAMSAAFAETETFTLPPETATLKKSSDPGYEKAEGVCSACHSVDYIATQPPGKGKAFWAAEVKKMKMTFGAPVEDSDMPDIVDYLSKNY